MKKMIYSSLCIVFCLILSAGCGASVDSDESVISIDKKGTVTFLDVAAFDESYYDESELKDEIDAEVDAYNSEHEKGSVKTEEFSVKDQIARLKLKFKTAEDFSDFMGIELYQGKVVTALAEGISFDVEFSRVEDGEITGTATKQDIYGESDLKVVIFKANANVKISGDICYVSGENVEVTGTDSVSVRDEYRDDEGLSESDSSTYIVYK